jgi:multidrug efflux system membrane fusion protein
VDRGRRRGRPPDPLPGRLPGRKPASEERGRPTAAGRPGAPRTVPVVAAEARSGDLPVHLIGLGTVTPLNTVTVRSRVDGQLLSVEYKEGQLVRQGELLAQIDPRRSRSSSRRPKGQQAKDRAALQNAQADLARFTTLQEAGVLPSQQLDAQRAAVRQLEASLQSDQGLIDAAKLNITYRPDHGADFGARRPAPRRPRQHRPRLRRDRHRRDHAARAHHGHLHASRRPAAQVLARFRAGQALPVAAFDRDMRRQLASGALAAIDNQIDPTTGTVRLKATFPNQDGALFPNQFVNASLLVDNPEGRGPHPAAGIQRSPQSTYVWFVKPDSTVEMRDVEVGLTEGDTAQIRKGLAAGDRVVTDGVDKLQPGTKVAVSAAGAERSPHQAATADSPPPGSAAGQNGATGSSSASRPRFRGLLERARSRP